jgi:ABC-type multidrug transport system fused ATPase/permease subunit
VAHRLSTVRHATQICVLVAGAIVERGSHDELVALKDGQYQKMWMAQQDTDEGG